MIYTKVLSSEQDRELAEFDANRILRKLNYFPFINARNAPLLQENFKDPKWMGAFCDMSAAAVTQFHYRNMINLQEVWSTVSDFFHQSIQMRGFDPVPEPEAQFYLDDKNNAQVEFLVAGTQAKEVYQARVDGCLDALYKIKPTKCRITFSGANPAENMHAMGLEGGVSTYNEALEMELYFRIKIDQKPLPDQIQWSTKRDMASATSVENIQSFFQTINLQKETQNHVYIVSSLFHLPRFIDLTLKKIREDNIPVKELTFVSAENPIKEDLTPAISTPDYLKSCMFEFYFQLYKQTDLKDISRPAHVHV